MKLKSLAVAMILADNRNIGLEEATTQLSNMSFKEYHNILEGNTTIVPPSGNTIDPSTAPASNTTQAANGPQQAPSNVKSIWPGAGAPVEVGMTVGLKGPNGVPVPGQVSQVDMAAKGVKVKNPTTGQEEWANLNALEPFAANTQPNPGAPATTQPTTEEASDLKRLRELAGIKENCSAGATGAGAIAVAPAATGAMKRRQATDEQLKKEYTPKEAPKTIVGDTKPFQASGQLSATLAANGKKTASRINNGRKRK